MKQLIISTVLNTIITLSASAYASGNDQAHPAPSGSQRQYVPIVPIKVIDAALGFEIELKVDNADVCVLWPKHLQDPVACAQVDTKTFNKLYALVKRGPLVMASLRHDDGITTLTILASAGVVKSDIQIDGHFAGMAEGLAPSPSMIVKMTGSQPGSRYDIIKVNGINAGRYEATIEAPPSSPEPYSKHSIGYSLFGDRSMISISFSTDSTHVNQMRQSAASIMKTVHWSNRSSKEVVDIEPRAPEKSLGKQEKRAEKTYDWVAGLVLLLVMIAAMYGLKSRAKREP